MFVVIVLGFVEVWVVNVWLKMKVLDVEDGKWGFMVLQYDNVLGLELDSGVFVEEVLERVYFQSLWYVFYFFSLRKYVELSFSLLKVFSKFIFKVQILSYV